MMLIRSKSELAKAVREVERLQDAKPGSGEEKRRNELEGAIEAYYAKNKNELKRAKPGD